MSEKELSLNEIHQETLTVLRKIISICEIINVDYCLGYGSMLGAVRHGGFIPWDDDLDIIMMRQDFDKFVSYCTKHSDQLIPYKLISIESNPDYPYCIPRFCDTRYKMVTSDDTPDAGMGMFIDIYPFDGAGKMSEKQIKMTAMKKKFLMECLYYNDRKKYVGSKKRGIYSFIRFFIYVYARLAGKQHFVKALNKLAYKYDYSDSENVECMIWNQWCKPVPKRVFSSYITVPFETIQVKIPEGYDTFLKIVYGNYMELPPEEKRHPTHSYSLYRIAVK